VVDLARFSPASVAPREGPLGLLYAGTVGLAHGLETLVEAAQLAGGEVVQVTIAGDGAERARIEQLANATNNVRVLGTVSSAEIPRLYERADASAVLLRDLPIFAAAVPTKMLEAMAAGRPLLLSARGESARLVEQAGAGIVVPPGNPKALADALALLQRDPDLRATLGDAGRRYAEANFGARRAAEQWIAELTAALEQHERSPRRPSRRA
jgi:glycosyltransferase involved in cell wall biosynthesis